MGFSVLGFPQREKNKTKQTNKPSKKSPTILTDTEFQFCNMERVLGMDGGDGYTIM
jgi:hypothetical protein